MSKLTCNGFCFAKKGGCAKTGLSWTYTQQEDGCGFLAWGPAWFPVTKQELSFWPPHAVLKGSVKKCGWEWWQENNSCIV